MIPSGSDATKTVQLLAICAAGAVVVAALIGSAVAALSAVLVALVAWRVGVKAAAGAGALAVVIVVADTFPPALGEIPAIIGTAALMAAAIVIPGSLKQLSGALETTLAELAARPAEPRKREPTPPRGAPATPPPPKKAVPKLVEEQVDRESRTELDVIRRFLRDARESLGADDMMFWRYSPSDDDLHPHSWATDPDVTPRFLEEPRTGALVRRASEERTVAGNPESERAVFLAGPVGNREQLHGVLAIYAADSHVLPRERARRWLGRYASHVGLLLDLLEEGRTARRYRAKGQRFDQVVARISKENMEFAELARAVCDNAVDLATATRSALLIWDPSIAVGTIRAASPAHPIPVGFEVAGDSLLAQCAREGQRFIVRDAAKMGPGRPIYGAKEPKRAIGSVGIAPFKRGDKVLGAIVVEGDAPSQITAVEVELLWQLSPIVAGAIEATHEMEKLGESAYKDALTGLPNRRYFDQRLSQHLAESDRYGQPTSLILMDVDHFKAVNDTHGHQGGDAVLKQIAVVVNAGVRLPIDVCCRFGGEELAIVLPNTPMVGACEVAERLRRAVETQFTILGVRKVQVTASFGVATYPDSTRSSDQLFAAADRALYEAKAAGRNCVKSYGVKV
jgi:diguanylate cyclase (GGDEF)-like protein